LAGLGLLSKVLADLVAFARAFDTAYRCPLFAAITAEVIIAVAVVDVGEGQVSGVVSFVLAVETG
jgi:hypothetical protein